MKDVKYSEAFTPVFMIGFVLTILIASDTAAVDTSALSKGGLS
jgi:hypothetical protein